MTVIDLKCRTEREELVRARESTHLSSATAGASRLSVLRLGFGLILDGHFDGDGLGAGEMVDLDV